MWGWEMKRRKKKGIDYDEPSIRRAALGLAVQLPENEKLALKVIDEVREIIRFRHRGNGKTKPEHRVLS